MFGKPGLDQTPAGGEIVVFRGEGPDAMEVIGEDNDGVDGEGAGGSNGSEGVAQQVNGGGRGQNGPTTIGDNGEEV
jgi:hypothetical protein